MKKTILPLVCLSLLSIGGLFAQASITGVSTAAANKIAVVEEFTGVRCPNCPDGHQVLEQIMTTHGNNAVVLSYHPNNSSFTTPYAGDPDLQRAYPAPFYTTPYCGSTRFMPSAFINRREYSNERLQGRGVWESYVTAMVGESSPLNVGVIANYNEATTTLDITAEVYYTSTVTDLNSVYVVLIQDGIVVAQQSGATGSYTQNRVFREGFAAQWGDAIATTSQGTLARFDYTFNNATMLYDMSQTQVVAFVENKATEEIYSGAKANVILNGVGIADSKELAANVYPNPTSGDARLVFDLPSSGKVEWSISSLQGREMAHGTTQDLPAGRHQQLIPSDGLAAGIYFIHIQSETGSVTRRLVVQ